MNKTELVAKLAERTGLTQVKCGEIINTLFDGESGIISDELASRGKVALPGFGTFGVRLKPARTGSNPKTQKPMHIPERYMPHFKASQNLKERLRG